MSEIFFFYGKFWEVCVDVDGIGIYVIIIVFIGRGKKFYEN